MAPDDAPDDTVQQTHAARRLGCAIVHLPARLREQDVEAAFEGVSSSSPQPAVWFGFIPPQPVYRAVYEVAARCGLRLLNDPDQHRTVFELDNAYPYLEDLTPKTVVVRSPDEVEAAHDALPLPWFVRGAMLSNKKKGREACVAETLADARRIVAELLDNAHLSRGRVLLRELLALRTAPIHGYALPAGREYRVFVHRGEVMGHGFYWPYLLDFATLQPEEEHEVLDLARRAAARLPTPWVSLDIAQTEDGRWVLLETGDPQFSGLGLMPCAEMVRRLVAAVDGA